MSEYINNLVNGVQSFLTGMRLTLDHMIHKKEKVATLQYPHEKWPIPERNIGFDHSEYNLIRSRLHVDIDDCIACMQCERACPVDCIKIDFIKPPKDNDIDCGITSNDTQKKMIVSRFTIDMSECMYCNLCVYPCPEECIYMVGGPNAQKHEIDYEFSQYGRDGMIFEFADATDEQIREAGGVKWLDQRDAQLTKNNDGIELKGMIPEQEVQSKEILKTETKILESKHTIEVNKSDHLEIKSFNDISDKMSRGIAKKAFTSAKRNGMDDTAVLATVVQALSDNGKMNDSIQKMLDELTYTSKNIIRQQIVKTDESSKVDGAPRNVEVKNIDHPKDIDIKDLNEIDDKMVRGIAKKAFVSAKRLGVNKVDAICQAIVDADKMDGSIEDFFKKYSNSDININEEKQENNDTVNVVIENDDLVDSEVQKKAMDLFDIAGLNAIDDKMCRGMAKKIYTKGKRADKNRMEVINEIRASLIEMNKMDESIEEILKNLEG